jgi:hypothetical protein
MIALESHIRFEERQLFNHLQEILSEADLAAIAVSMNQRTKESLPPWTDLFWESK